MLKTDSTKHKKIVAIFATLLIVVSGAISAFIPIIQPSSADSNPATWILCKSPDGRALYNALVTDALPYALRSKSSTAKVDKVNGSPLNSLLEVTGAFDFTATNEQILGRTLDANYIEDEVTTGENATATKVNPFMRFGMSGLTWSSYSGEWKYYLVDACKKQTIVYKTNFGQLYEGRREPKSAYNEAESSDDPRTIQFSKGLFSSWGAAFNDVLSNAIFSIAKAVVTLTIVALGLAFSDVSELIGLTSSDPNGGAIGIFNNLSNGLFTPLIVLAFLLTGLYLLYKGLIKRQYREALVGGLVQTLLCFFFGFVIGAAPLFWIPLPNKAATIGQALIISALGNTAESGGDLCSINTDTETVNTGDVNIDDALGDDTEPFAEVGYDMQRVMGCRLWQEFLFKPWARGQFGAEFPALNVIGSADSEMTNVNGAWVGDAGVPLGGGTVMNNWALFQLSTQTNTHSQIDRENNRPTYITGVTVDWWRVVDAMSNYEETIIEDGEVIYVLPLVNTPTKFWEHWMGNRSIERTGTALLAVIFSIAGCISLIVLGFASAIFGVGITFLMMISPIAFLMGCWAGRGQDFFRGWLAMLLNAVIKKIAIAGLIILDFSLIMACMNMIDSMGWVKAFVLLVVVSVILVKNKNKILDSFASIDFGSGFNGGTFNRWLENWKRRGKNAATVSTAAAVGAVTAKQAGMTAREGAKTAGVNQLINTMYQTPTGRKAANAYQNEKNRKVGGKWNCIVCGMPIKPGTIAFTDDMGNHYCQYCGEETDNDELVEVIAPSREPVEDTEEYYLSHERSNRVTSNRSGMRYNAIETSIGYTRDPDTHKTSWDNEGVKNMMLDNISHLNRDMVEYEYARQQLVTKGVDTKQLAPPLTPEPIREYLDPIAINQAWQNGRYDAVDVTYRDAWNKWYSDNSRIVNTLTDEEKAEVTQALREFAPIDNDPGAGKDPDAKYNAQTQVKGVVHKLRYNETFGGNEGNFDGNANKYAEYVKPTTREQAIADVYHDRISADVDLASREAIISSNKEEIEKLTESINEIDAKGDKITLDDERKLSEYAEIKQERYAEIKHKENEKLEILKQRSTLDKRSAALRAHGHAQVEPENIAPTPLEERPEYIKNFKAEQPKPLSTEPTTPDATEIEDTTTEESGQ